ncbi:MAG: GIY-YIG nuclease family protein [Candidatus Rokuibacteriota bacterium]
MYTDDYGRRWEGPHPFNRSEISQHAPPRSGVYQLLYSDGTALHVAYIGIATGDTIRGRLTRHATGSGNWALARLADPTAFTFVYWECDALSAKQVESHVITTKKPPFNVKAEYRHFIPSIAVH